MLLHLDTPSFSIISNVWFVWVTEHPSLTILINRRDRRAFSRSRKNPDERLRSLDAVSPTRTLEQWWATTKVAMGLSEAVDGQFVW
jgi:hypothetical protein